MQIKDLRKTEIFQSLRKEQLLAVDPILEFILGRSREYFITNPDYILTDDQLNKIFDLINQFKNGKPLSQIIFKKEFYGLDFYVTGDVLTPRPESEQIVNLVLKYINDQKIQQAKILDIGIGSGNILFSILKNLKPSFSGIGFELSDEALKVAEHNMNKLDLQERVILKKSDLLEKNTEAVIEIIVANLPYIGTEKYNFVSKDAHNYEPHIALYGGEDGLELYRELFKQMKESNLQFDLFAGEFGFGQELSMRDELSKYFQKFDILNDLAGIPRIFVVKR